MPIRQKLKLRMLLIATAALAFALACNFFNPHYEVEDLKATDMAATQTKSAANANATITALVKALTPQPTETATPRPADECLRWSELGTCLSNPSLDMESPPTDEWTPNSGLLEGEMRINGGRSWVPYFDQTGVQLGVVRDASTWPGNGNNFNLTVWVRDDELGLSAENQGTPVPIVVGQTKGQVIICPPHKWGHPGERIHCHGWDINGSLLVNFIAGLSYTVTGPDSWQWIIEYEGERVYRHGWVVTFDGTFRY